MPVHHPDESNRAERSTASTARAPGRRPATPVERAAGQPPWPRFEPGDVLVFLEEHPQVKVVVAATDDPARAISHAAERLVADGICVASHRRAAVTRVRFGSVTARLLHLCRQPVLVLHPSE